MTQGNTEKDGRTRLAITGLFLMSAILFAWAGASYLTGSPYFYLAVAALALGAIATAATFRYGGDSDDGTPEAEEAEA